MSRTVEVASAAQRERAVRALWLAHEFDTLTIAALLGMGEADVARIIAKRESDVVPLGLAPLETGPFRARPDLDL